jgi:lambda family phage tail tape measure protein
MPSNSLGTLTLDLIAKIGSFTGPMDKASQNAKKNMNEIKVSTIAAGVAIGEFAGNVIGSIPGALQHMITGAAESAKEITNLSRVAGLSTTDFQKLAAGAATVGVEQDKLSDILKDVNDKVGDFMNTGGGALQDFFTAIAPKVGVTAEQFKKLNSADALQLYVTSLQKANVSQSEMTFYMEAIANDATALVPLLKNGGKGFADLGNAAEAAGAIMSGETIQAAQDFNAQLVVLGQYVDSAKISLAAEFLPVVAQFSKDVNQAAKDGGGLTSVVGELGDKLVNTTAFVASAGDGVVRVFDIAGNTIVGLYATAVAHMSSLMGDLAAGLSKITLGEVAKGFSADSARLRDEAKLNFGIAAQAAAEIQQNLEKPMAGDVFKDYVKNAKAAAAEAAKVTADGNKGGSGSGVDPAKIKADAAAAAKALSDANAAAKKLQGTFDSAEQGYQREIELINTSVDARKNATEVAKLQFEIESGKLVGINGQQQKRLNGLASELDALKKLKQANEDAAKAVTYGDSLSQNNQSAKMGFDMELAGAGSGDKIKERLKADLQIQQDYNNQLADLQKQFNGGDISKGLYEQETEMLKESLAERMVLQHDYYNQVDAAQSNWLDGVSSAWENYKDTATDYQQQASDAVTGLLGDTTSSLSDQIRGLADGTEDLGTAFENLGITMSDSVLNSLSDIAAQWAVTHALKMAGIGAETLAVEGSEAAKAAAKVAGDSVATASTLSSLAATVAANVTAAATTMASWLPAALVASVGTFGAAAIVGGAGLLAAFALIKGFSGGGYTGAGGVNDPAGIVHKGEVVWSQADIARAGGVASVEAMRNGQVPLVKSAATAESSAKLDRSIARASQGATQNQSRPMVVNLHEDASRAGQVNRRQLSEQDVIDIYTANIRSEGDIHQANQSKYGLTAKGY